MERLDKYISSQTGRTRSEARKFILTRGANVNGRTVKVPDFKINPEHDRVVIEGKEIKYEKFVYFMLNKPAGVISASEDKKEKTVIDLIDENDRRSGLFPAGRLDRDTKGLLVITNDGELAHKMLSPSKGVFKTYVALLDAPLSEQEIWLLENGITIDGGEKCLPAQVKIFDNCLTEIKICQGKFHQVKRMFAAVGKNVLELTRTAIGTLELDRALEEGQYKRLSPDDLDKLFKNSN